VSLQGPLTRLLNFKKIRGWFVHYANGGYGGGKPKKQQVNKLDKVKKSDKFMKTYTRRDIIVAEYEDRIKDDISKLSGGAKQGSKQWLKCYSTAINNVVEALTPAEYELVDDKIEEWNSIGPPTSVKAA